MINRLIYGVHRVLGTVLCLLPLCAIPVRGESFVNDSLKVDGTWRHFTVFLPAGLQNDAPLVFVLHGYGGGIVRENPMTNAARKHGFALCIPRGLKDPQNKNSWNVGYPFQEGWKQNDVKAL